MSMGRRIDMTAVSKIQKGETTRAQVLELLGAPDGSSRDGDGQVTYSYGYHRIASRPENYIPLVGGLVGGYDSQHQGVFVTFDRNDIVSNVVASSGGMEAGMNASAGGTVAPLEPYEAKRPR